MCAMCTHLVEIILAGKDTQPAHCLRSVWYLFVGEAHFYIYSLYILPSIPIDDNDGRISCGLFHNYICFTLS